MNPRSRSPVTGRASPVLLKLRPTEVASLVEEVHGLSSGDLDEMAVPTYTHYNPLVRWLFWRRHRCIFRLAAVQEGERVLDFGTGIGALLPSLCSCEAEVHATDLRDSIARLLASRRGLAVTFHAPESLGVSLDDGSLDAVIAADVLEHMEDTELSGQLALFAGKLRKGGRLVTCFPTENLLYRIGRVVAGYAGKGDYHKTPLARLASVVEAAGFVTIRRCSVPLPGPACFFQVVLYRLQ